MKMYNEEEKRPNMLCPKCKGGVPVYKKSIIAYCFYCNSKVGLICKAKRLCKKN